jgi:hypothetical protein
MKNPSNLVYLMLPKSYQITSSVNINLNRQHVVWTLSMHNSDCTLLHQASVLPGTPGIGSSRTECSFVVLLSHFSTKHHTIFDLIYFCLHSPTSLHHHQHGTYSQADEESLFKDESRSPPGESTCRWIKEDIQSPLPIKCLNFQSSL